MAGFRSGNHLFRVSSDANAARAERNSNVPFDAMNTVIINVGGVRHEVGQATLNTHPGTKLAELDRLPEHYRKTKGEYYFDRHPEIFSTILNYYRTGELHMPQDVCGPAFKLELDYWGLEEVNIQECCWVKYNVDRATRDTLELLGDKYKQEQEQALLLATVDDSVKKYWKRWYKCRIALWTFLDNPLSSKGAKAYAVISFLLALLSIVVFCAETHPSLEIEMTAEHYAEYYGVPLHELYNDWYNTPNLTTPSATGEEVDNNETQYERLEHLRVPHPTLVTMDMVLMGLFTIDLILRFIACPRKLRFFTEWLNVVEAISILPFYIEVIVESFFIQETYRHNFVDALFTLKVLRIFRIMRLLRHYKGLQVLALTLKFSYKELVLLAVFLFICTVIFASLIFFANHGDKNFQSIPHSFWWAIITMTTVGYGDVYPTTDAGYFVGSLCALSGVLVIAFTVPTLVNNFLMFYSHVQYRKPKPKPPTVPLESTKVGPVTVDQTMETVSLGPTEPS